MKKWLARTALILVGLIIGAVVGAGFVVYYFAENLKTVNQMFALGYCAWESEEALFQYKNGNTELAKHSLEHYALISEGFKEFNHKTNTNFIPASADLGFTYVRLGNIAEKEGDVNAAKEYFQKALENYKHHCDQNNIKREYTEESFRAFVNKLDEKNKETVRMPFSAVLSLEKNKNVSNTKMKADE